MLKLHAVGRQVVGSKPDCTVKLGIPIYIDVKYLQNYLNPPIFEAGILAGSMYFPGIYQVFLRFFE